MAVWRSRLAVEDRLGVVLEAASRRVQKLVSRHNRPWPTVTAKPRVSIDEDSILVWYGGVARVRRMQLLLSAYTS